MPQRPNILFIITDQQSRHMMSCAGNRYLKTPAMDSLAETGMRFTRAYCTNPVCVPSRFSLFTGRMPSAIGLDWNGPVRDRDALEEVKKTGLGWALRDAGYSAFFAGKQHLPRMEAEDLGFEVLSTDERDELAEVTARFVGEKNEKPWFLVASFINPHDICYMALNDYEQRDAERVRYVPELETVLARAREIPEDEFFEKHCPPLPPNFEPQEDEPEEVGVLLHKRPFRMAARENWDERRWRLHRWAYARLTERVDGQIRKLLDALRSGPAADNTVIIFTSDHGDHDASHRMEHKTFPYEEAVGVPFIISQPGAKDGMVNDRDLVSTGLDLFATVCDYAGIDVASHLEGISLRPLVEGRELTEQRQAVWIETVAGNAAVSGRYKYLKCHSGEGAEQLFDLEADPYETRNAAGDLHQQEALALHRKLFAELYLTHSK